MTNINLEATELTILYHKTSKFTSFFPSFVKKDGRNKYNFFLSNILSKRGKGKRRFKLLTPLHNAWSLVN
jgi:hypothetical protein